MLRKPLTALALASLITLPLAAQENGDAAFQQTLRAYRATESLQEKAQILGEFARAYPDHHAAPDALGVAVRFYEEGMDDADSAVALVRDVVAGSSHPAQRNQLLSMLLELYGRLGRTEELREAVAQMPADAGYGLYLAAAEAAADTGQFRMTLENADKALELATLENVRQALSRGGRQLPDYYVQRRADGVRSSALALRGYALANLGRLDEALDTFEQADPLTQKFYVGAADGKLHYYWAAALLEAGRVAEAIRRIAPDAVMLGDEDAEELLRRAHVIYSTGGEGYEQFLADQRARIAVDYSDFALADYQGDEHAFSSLRADVTVLSFWFPT